jgi:hypothetical protein
MLGAAINPDGPWTTRKPEICRQASAIGPDDSGYSFGIEPASSHAPSTPSQRPHRSPAAAPSATRTPQSRGQARRIVRQPILGGLVNEYRQAA